MAFCLFPHVSPRSQNKNNHESLLWPVSIGMYKNITIPEATNLTMIILLPGILYIFLVQKSTLYILSNFLNKEYLPKSSRFPLVFNLLVSICEYLLIAAFWLCVRIEKCSLSDKLCRFEYTEIEILCALPYFQ